MKRCFILGVSHRTGTNFLARVLRMHPHVEFSEPVWEDYLVHHAAKLEKYVDGVIGSYADQWVDELGGSPKPKLMALLGNALGEYQDQMALASRATQEDKRNLPVEVVLTKTPSVKGIQFFFDLFPNDKLLVIQRDGRAVSESAAVSFRIPHELCMRKWAKRADTLADFLDGPHGQHPGLLVLRYEDLVTDTPELTRQVLAWLGLDQAEFPFGQLGAVPVFGSSETIEKDGKLHWQAVARDENFDPLTRFAHWNDDLHEQFNDIAGEAQLRLGYDVKKTHP